MKRKPLFWVILLALTSNKGSHDFQLTEDANGERLFEKVLKKSQDWATDEQMMYVVGATQGKMFLDIRKHAPNHFLLVPGVGEIIGGSQREDDYEKLLGRMKELGLAEEDYGFYLDLRKYGSTRHAGFGLGFERMVMYATGIANIRDVIPYPRTVGKCQY